MRDDNRYDDSRDEFDTGRRSDSGSTLPMPTIPWGWAPSSFRSDDEGLPRDDHDTVAPETERYREGRPTDDRFAGDVPDNEPDRTEDESWIGEGLITLLIVGGALLFLFPEPATSALGIVMLGIGILAWLANLTM